MDAVWETFITQMGDARAFISFNQSFAKLADNDKRTMLLKVRAVIKNPTPAGMPTNEEFPSLVKVEDGLDSEVSAKGGLEVGRLTVSGKRFFSFYVSFPESVAKEIVAKVAKDTQYNLQYVYEQDNAKAGYWKELYPTADDWQVIRDMKVLDTLRSNGDRQDRARQVDHWAYFLTQQNAKRFADWANANHYKVKSVGPMNDAKKIPVLFTHNGTMALEDITTRTIEINRKAEELQGDYDGWETSVERK